MAMAHHGMRRERAVPPRSSATRYRSSHADSYVVCVIILAHKLSL
jgi:hypothetical protein